MKRSKFDDPQPENAIEVSAALDERNLLPREVFASIHGPDPADRGTRFEGWAADVYPLGKEPYSTNEEGFETCGFAGRDDLLDALNAAGVTRHVFPAPRMKAAE